MESIKNNLQEARSVLEEFIAEEKNIKAIHDAGNMMVNALNSGKKIIACGNGGSMSDAMHFCEELTGRFKEHRKSLAAIAISDPAYLSCTANDYGYENVFARFVEGVGNEGDVLLAISTSGNSQNVLNAIETAHQKNMKITALSGKNGGKMASIVNVEIRAPKSEYSDRTQEIHIKVIHALIDYIEQHVSA